MVVKYSKSFTITGAITVEPVTILIEYVEAEGFKGVSIESLEGEYDSTEEFENAYRRVVKDKVDEEKIYTFLPMTLPDAHRLMDTLNEAIAASMEV